MAEQAESTEAVEASEIDGEIAESDAEAKPAAREETLEERVEAKSHHPAHSKSTKIKDFRDTENPKGFPVNSHAEKDGERSYNTIDGAVAIIYYVDEKTGKVYFSLERKTKTHPSKGKLALWGGTAKVGEPHNETLVRELSEEEDPRGYKIALNALRNNGYKLTELVERVDGRTSRTSVYVAEIKGAAKWEEYISAKKTSHEGEKAILSFGEIVAAINGHSFAYPQQGDALEMLLKTGLQAKTHTASHHAYNIFRSDMFYTTSQFKFGSGLTTGVIAPFITNSYPLLTSAESRCLCNKPS